VLKPLLIIFSAFLIPFTAFSQEKQTPPPPPSPSAQYTIPVEAARQANPIKPTAESLARGKKMYTMDCAMCHGKDGDGKGDVAADMPVKLGDFRDPATLKDRTDGEIFYIIKNGKGQMPAEGERTKTDQVWDMVNYVRSFAGKKAVPEDKGTPAEKPN
jgi:mono/diheme cytochrome c family protein